MEMKITSTTSHDVIRIDIWVYHGPESISRLKL